MSGLGFVRASVLAVALMALLEGVSAAAPGQATIVAPVGDISGSTIAFTWQPVTQSTWYLLWVGVGSTPNSQRWYTAEQAGCTGGGTCTVMATLGLPPGPYSWYVQTWNSTGYGPWSNRLDIAMKDVPPTLSRKLPTAQRFDLVLDNQAVLDKETGLVWERTPSATKVSWIPAAYTCIYAARGNRAGWHLATISELKTLVDATQSPTLPAGNPFVLGTDLKFWSQTGSLDQASNGLLLDFASNFLFQAAKASWQARPWCVRGGNGVPIQ